MGSSPGSSSQTQRYNSAETPQLQTVFFARLFAKKFVHGWSPPWHSHGEALG